MIIVASAARIDSLHVAYGLMESGLTVLGQHAPSSREALSMSSWTDPLNKGVFFETNPHRPTRRYLFPEPTTSSVVVMSPAGVTMSDPAYLDHVIVIVRPWRCSEDPLEWLRVLYNQLADSSLRRYPTWIRTAETLRESPDRAAIELVSFLGTDRDPAPIEAAFRDLQPKLPRHDEDPNADILDALYHALRDRTDICDTLVARINDALRIQSEQS